MMRQLILAAARSERLKDASMRLGSVRSIVGRFVAGDEPEDALRTVRRLAEQGLRATVDHLGEDTTTPEAAIAAADANVDLLRRLADAGLAPVAEVSVKASAIGQALPGGAELSAELGHRICATAREVGTTVTFDMEGHATTDATLALVAALRRTFPSTGAVLQAMLHRTTADAAAWAVAGSRIRLCKGAYAEPASVAHTTAPAIADAYRSCLALLVMGEGYPMIATHDPALIAFAQRVLEGSGRTPQEYEFQMLLGVRPDEQLRLASQGHTVRVYVPWGEDWYGYFMRRLAEKPAHLALLARALISRR